MTATNQLNQQQMLQQQKAEQQKKKKKKRKHSFDSIFSIGKSIIFTLALVDNNLIYLFSIERICFNAAYPRFCFEAILEMKKTSLFLLFYFLFLFQLPFAAVCKHLQYNVYVSACVIVC